MTPFLPSDEVNRKVRRIALTATVSRTVQIGLRTLQVPLAFRVLTASEYGAWLAIANLIAFFSITDLGVGQSATQQLTTLLARGDLRAARRTTSSVLLIYAVLASICLLATTILASTTFLHRFLGIPPGNTPQTTLTIVVMAISVSTALQLLSRSGFTVNDVLLSSHCNYLAALIGSVITATALLVMASCGGGLGAFAVAMSVPPALTASIAAVWAFKREKELRPRFECLQVREVGRVLSRAFPLFIVQVSDYAIYYLPVVFIGQAFGLEQVTAYSIPVGLFMFAVNVLASARQPYAILYRTSLEKGQSTWVVRQHVKILLTTVACYVAFSVCVVANADFIYKLLTHGKLQALTSLLAAQSVYFGLLLILQLNALLLLGAGRNTVKATLQVLNAAGVVYSFVYFSKTHSLTACIYVCCILFIVDFAITAYVLKTLLAPVRPNIATRATVSPSEEESDPLCTT